MGRKENFRNENIAPNLRSNKFTIIMLRIPDGNSSSSSSSSSEKKKKKGNTGEAPVFTQGWFRPAPPVVSNSGCRACFQCGSTKHLRSQCSERKQTPAGFAAFDKFKRRKSSHRFNKNTTSS